MSLEHMRPRLITAGLASEAEVEHARRLFAQPSTRALPPLMVTAWARRGRAGR